MSGYVPMEGLPLFEQGPEARARDAVLDRLETVRGAYIERLRARLVQLYLERNFRVRAHGEHAEEVYVTSTDARAILQAWPDVPPPKELNRNFLGAVFRGPDWSPCGSETSETPGRRGALIRRWKYVGATTTSPGPGERRSESLRTGSDLQPEGRRQARLSSLHPEDHHGN